jgi:hypothetical protein
MKKIIRLTESDLNRIIRRVISENQYLTEDVTSNIPDVTIYLPYTLNPKDQSKNFKMDQRAKFTISAVKSPDGSFNTSTYKTPIKSISIDGIGPVQNTTTSGSMNQTDGSIKGSFVLTKDMYNKLKDYLGKGWQHGSQKMVVNVGEGKYASFQISEYNMAPTQK